VTRQIRIGIAAVAVSAVALAIVLVLAHRKRDEPVDLPPLSCGATARVLAYDTTDLPRHTWLVAELANLCTVDHWPDAIHACLARGDDDCMATLDEAPARRVRGRYALATSACFDVAEMVARAHRCTHDLDTDLDRLADNLASGGAANCAELRERATAAVSRCEVVRH